MANNSKETLRKILAFKTDAETRTSVLVAMLLFPDEVERLLELLEEQEDLLIKESQDNTQTMSNVRIAMSLIRGAK